MTASAPFTPLPKAFGIRVSYTAVRQLISAIVLFINHTLSMETWMHFAFVVHVPGYTCPCKMRPCQNLHGHIEHGSMDAFCICGPCSRIHVSMQNASMKESRDFHPLENLFVFLRFFSSFRVGALHAHAGHTQQIISHSRFTFIKENE